MIKWHANVDISPGDLHNLARQLVDYTKLKIDQVMQIICKTFVKEARTIIGNFYRPHSEGMGKALFSQVSVCSHQGGGIPSPSHNISIHWSHVLSGGTPTQSWWGGGAPIWSQWRYHHPVLTGGAHRVQTGVSIQVRMGYSRIGPGLDGGYPHQDWMGVPLPPPPPKGDRGAEWVLGTRRAVCLLRSRRRTFLLELFHFICTILD